MGKEVVRALLGGARRGEEAVQVRRWILSHGIVKWKDATRARRAMELQLRDSV